MFASLVGSELTDLGLPVKGIVAHWCAEFAKPLFFARRGVRRRNNTSEVTSIHEWHKEDVIFGHVGLEFRLGGKRYHYDSNGLEKPTGILMEMPVYRGRMTIPELVALASTQDGWNEQFDRKCIPKLEQYIWASFKRVKSLD